jgi:hypothetical protein
MPGLQSWSSEDLEMAADLMVGTMLETIQALLEVDPCYPDDEAQVIHRAEHQLRLIALGMAAWPG